MVLTDAGRARPLVDDSDLAEEGVACDVLDDAVVADNLNAPALEEEHLAARLTLC